MKIAVIGSGELARAIAGRLGDAGIDVASPGDVDLVVWASDGVTTRAALVENERCVRAGTPVLFAIGEGERVVLGPLCVPARTACLACVSAGARGRDRPIPAASPLVAERVADDVVAMVRQIPGAGPVTVACRQSWISASGVDRTRGAWPRHGCQVCALATGRPGPFDLAAALALRESPPCTGIPAGGGVRPLRRVGVVGGGTAGYLTAIALKRARPSLEVTVVESSTIPVIGVGEATTPDLVQFLYRSLGIREADLYREVAPTWKLGIRFLWGGPDDAPFHHPFAGERLLEALVHAGDPDLQSLSSQLMVHGLAPVLRRPDGKALSLLSTTPYAYHLDNERFVRFLRSTAAREGVAHLDCVVADASRAPDGSIDSLRSEDGRTHSFDFYVDATGFRSLLLEKALGVRFESYASSLLADAAVVADVPACPRLDPYTLAEAMDAGWCWNIPQRDSNRRGYVFSSRFLSADAAEAEMRAKNQGMGEARIIRFRSGRHVDCWVQNVFAVGNAYAFVEPLESTALHMVVHQILLLLQTLPTDGDADAVRPRVNRAVASHWDCLRGLLALHYAFNDRRQTPFWRTCRHELDLAQGRDMVEAFRSGAPLSARADRALLESSVLGTGYFGLLGIDNVLFGQGVPTRLLETDADRGPFDRWVRRGLPEVLSRALPHREALEAYEALLREDERPERG